MPLLDLPNEILGSIIDRVDLGDLDHFAESSPLLKSLATHALEVHHERQQEYTHIEVFGCLEHVGPHPLQLLERICANPQVAWYPTSLKVECCSGWGTEHDDEDFAPLLNDEEFDKNLDSEDFYGEYCWNNNLRNVYRVIKFWAEDIRDLVFHSGYFDEEESECWYNQIRKGNHEAVVGLLLTLLPNLEIVEFEAYSTRVFLLVKIVQCITGPPRESSKKTKEGARVLKKLREVRLSGWEYTQGEEDLTLAGYFARLPSMRRVCAVEDSRSSTPSSHPWTQRESGSSNIDEIYMEHAHMNLMSVVDCLRYLKTLRKFHYDWYRGWYRGPLPRMRCEDLGLILAGLVEHFQSSLESLCLKGIDHVRLEGSIETSISLDAFKKLINASLPYQLFVSVPKLQPEASAPIEGGHDLQTPNSPIFSRLVDVLPRSMEVVTLSGAIEVKNVERMLSGLVSHKAERLPRLSKIIFSSFLTHHVPSRAIARILQTQCRRIGIELVLGDLMALTERFLSLE